MEWLGYVFFGLIVLGIIVRIADAQRERDAHRAMIEMNERNKRGG